MILEIIRSLFIVLIGSIYTILSSVVAIILAIRNPYSDRVNNFIRFWGRSILFISGIELEIEGEEKLNNTPSVYMANHESLFDIIASVISIPGTARFIAKKELFRIPVFAQGLKMIGTIKIDRGNSAKARASINEAITVIREGVSVIIFPEGTRSRDGMIKPFKKGGVVLAMNGKIPIVPMAISGSNYIMGKNSLRLRKGHIRVVFLDPIDTTNKIYDERNLLLAEIRESIIKHHDKDFNKEK